MLFNSFEFFAFFIVFFSLYWFAFRNSVKLQNLLILAGSYFFYAWVDWHFLFFLIGVSALNYFLGIWIERGEGKWYRKWLLYIGLLQGIGGLIYFKYTNFFITSFNDAFSSIGISLGWETLHILVPLGISFFTFRTISYLLDIDKGKLVATKDPVVFFDYVAFFPTILSGPIDKAIKFVPQLENPRVFTYDRAADGMRQILWGLFKKIVIANNCAILTNEIFKNYETLPASTLVIGAILYTIQIYADFSGYSDMAIGISRLLGFEITQNFNYPFFAQNVADFWRRWHISLTAWLTEYVFTPLSIAFRDYGKAGLIAAIIINLVVVGIWHGANWTFALFGLVHGLFFIPLILSGTMNKKQKIAKELKFPTLPMFFAMLKTFALVVFALVIFRADSVAHAFGYFSNMISPTLLKMPKLDLTTFAISCLFIAMMFIIEWRNRDKHHGLYLGDVCSPLKRWSMYFFLLMSMLFFGIFSEAGFIYFQF